MNNLTILLVGEGGLGLWMNNWIRLHFECAGISFFGNQLGTELREMPDCVCAPSTPQTTTAATSIRNLFLFFYILFPSLSCVRSLLLFHLQRIGNSHSTWDRPPFRLVILLPLWSSSLSHSNSQTDPITNLSIYQSAAAAAAACSSSLIKRWLVHCGPFARHVLQPR